MRSSKFIYIVFLFILIQLPVQGISVFAEIGTDLKAHNESNEVSEDNISLNFDTYFDGPELTILLANKFRQFFNDNDFVDHSNSLNVENRFSDFSSFSRIEYSKNAVDSVNGLNLQNTLFRTSEYSDASFEYGIDLNLFKLFDSYKFNTYSGGIYLNKRNFFTKVSLHQYCNIKFNQVEYKSNNSKSLFNLDYNIKISTPINDHSGLSVDLFLNYNLNSNDKVLFPREELFNDLCYNENKIQLRYKLLGQAIMINPHISYSRKEYLSSAVLKNFFEFNLSMGFYMDYLTQNGILIYSEVDYSSIKDELDRIDIVSLNIGMKYQLIFLDR